MQWPAAVIELYLGRRAADAVLAAATTPEEAGEARYYLGEWHLMRRDCVAGERELRLAVQALPAFFSEYMGAIVALERLDRAR